MLRAGGTLPPDALVNLSDIFGKFCAPTELIDVNAEFMLYHSFDTNTYKKAWEFAKGTAERKYEELVANHGRKYPGEPLSAAQQAILWCMAAGDARAWWKNFGRDTHAGL